ncbi:MAG: hypothetical protein MSJ26_00120 [Oscillospiraceae bacterium]|nr:hypothetical protein [Oscillospiraceae bacterium]
MVYLLIIAWVLSPLVLIPLSIAMCSRNAKLEGFVSELFKAGRISSMEYSGLKAKKEENDSPNAAEAPVFSDSIDRNISPVVPVCQKEQYTETPPRETVKPPEKQPSNPVFRDEENVNTVRQPAPVKSVSHEKRAGAMSVLMTIGIIFVILAGLVFSTAVWVSMGNFGRTCAIGAVSALFFGISAFVKSKLKLESTAFAFYTLGTFFSAITLITAGFFGLLGSYLSIGGGGSCILFAAAALIISFLSAKGYSIYGKAAAAYISVFGGAMSAVLMLIQLTDEWGIFAILMSLLTLAVNTAVFTLEANISEKWEKPVKTAAAALYAAAVLCGIAALSCSSAAAYICAGIYVIRSAAVAVMGIKGHSIYNKRLSGAISLLSGIFFTAAIMWKLSAALEIFALALAIFSLLFISGFYTFNVNIPNEWNGPVKLSAILLCASGLIFSLAALGNSFTEWNGVCFAVAGVYIVHSFAVGIMAARGHRSYENAPSAFASLFTGMTFSLMLIAELSKTEAVSAVILTALFLAFINTFYSVSPRLPEGWKAAVDTTAVILGLIGTIFSVFVLCDNFGDRDAACYVIAALYILQSLAIAVMAFKGHNVYSRTCWAVFSHITGLFFTVLLLSELAPSSEYFILFLAVFAVLFTSVSDITFLRAPEKWLSTAKVSEMLLNIAAALASAGMLIINSSDWNYCCFITAGMYILYTAFLGIRRQSSLLKGAECIISGFALYNVYSLISDKYENAPFFIFFIMLLVLALIHHYAKPLRTAFSDITITAAVIISALYPSGDENIYLLMSFLLTGILLLIKSAEKDAPMAGIFKVLLPLPVTGMVFTAMEMLSPEYVLSFGDKSAVSAAVLASVAAAVMIIWKKRSGTVFYTFAISAAVMTLPGMEYGNTGIQLLLLAVSVMLTVLFGSSANNLLSLITMFVSVQAVNGLAEIAEPNGSNYVHILAAVMTAAACLTASRIFFPKKLLERKDESFRLDTCCTGILFCIPILSYLSGKAALFAALTLLALFAANLARKEQHDDFNRAAITAACGLFTLALINRPFLVVTDTLISSKLTLGLICIFGYAFSKIWKKYPKLSENFPSAIYSISFVCLIIEALLYESLFNTLIVLGVSLTILLYSFVRKKKRWFAVSSIALTGLTLYIFRDFFLMIDWWIYLLAVGLILIAVSSANEYFIKKGRELKEKAGRFFEDWTW